MKNLIFALFVAMISVAGVNASANQDQPNKQELLEELAFLNDVVEEKVYTCEGYASCNFSHVTCYAYGDACSWEVVSRWQTDYYGRRYRQAGVRCTGYNRYGRWANFYAWCND